MEKTKKTHVLKRIQRFKDLINENKLQSYTIKYAQEYIDQFGNLDIPPQVIIEKQLVKYMKDLGGRCHQLKIYSDVVARKWQGQVQEWLSANNLTENQYFEQLDTNEKTIPTASPQLNGALKANQRNSGSDDGHNYPSSSSQEVESPDSQRANQRSIHHQSNHQPFLVRDPLSLSRESCSPSQLETQNHDSDEFNDNLSIDPKEVTPINKVQESPVKDRFCVSLKEKMFKAVKLKDPLVEENMLLLLDMCQNLNLSSVHYPEFLKNFWETKLRSPGQNIRNFGDCLRAIYGETEENKDSTHMPDTHHNHNIPSTSQQGARESSRSRPEHTPELLRCKKRMEEMVSAAMAKELKNEPPPFHDGKNLPSTSQQGARESSRSCPEHTPEILRWKKHMEEAKAKELKNEQPPFHNGKNLPSTSQAAEESSRNCSEFKNDRKRKHMESTHSFINSSKVKLKQQPTQDSKALSSMSQLGGMESAKTCPVSEHYRKRKHGESSQSVIKENELKEEQRLSLDSKSKHVLRTEYVTKGKETAQSAAKAYEFKDGCQKSQGGKVKLDPKRVCAMAFEARNCDKNHSKKRDSPDQSAMLAVTSSKKERTSVYHGGRTSRVSRLKDICVQALIKGIKQISDPTKLINKHHVDFEIIEPVLVLVSPDKLQKIEDKMKSLKKHTDEIWLFFCKRQFQSRLHLKKEHENWRTFYFRCCVESEEKLRSLTASISASASKAKPDRQIKFTTVNGLPTKRPKIDNAMVAKNHANNAAIKPLPNSCQPSISRSDVPVPLKGLSNHIKPSYKTIKKDAPLMHKAKKTLGQLHRIHRN